MSRKRMMFRSFKTGERYVMAGKQGPKWRRRSLRWYHRNLRVVRDYILGKKV